MPKFRVLAGKHCEGKTPEGKPKVYVKGDVVDSKSDLSRLNPPGFPPKFERVEDDGRPSPAPAVPVQTLSPTPTPVHATSPLPAAPKTVPDGLDKLSLKELQDLAASEEIDLKGAKTRDEVLRAVRAAI